MATDKKQDELGALWVKHSDTGEYMTGSVTIDGKTTPIVCFTNRHKKEAKHPDWRILLSQPRGERSAAPEPNREGLENLPNRGLHAGYMGKPPAAPSGIEYPKDDIDPVVHTPSRLRPEKSTA